MSWAEFIKTASVVDLERELNKKSDILTVEDRTKIVKAFLKRFSVIDLEKELFRHHRELTEELKDDLRKQWRIVHGKAEASDLNPAILTPEWWDVNRQDKLL